VELSERTHGSDGARSARRLRLERIEAVRAAIASGTYETDERLNVAIARLIDELRG
jgi:anti-sigma28 factor (negative regulator of flagellin synthesis)